MSLISLAREALAYRRCTKGAQGICNSCCRRKVTRTGNNANKVRCTADGEVTIKTIPVNKGTHRIVVCDKYEYDKFVTGMDDKIKRGNPADCENKCYFKSKTIDRVKIESIEDLNNPTAKGCALSDITGVEFYPREDENQGPCKHYAPGYIEAHSDKEWRR